MLEHVLRDALEPDPPLGEAHHPHPGLQGFGQQEAGRLAIGAVQETLQPEHERVDQRLAARRVVGLAGAFALVGEPGLVHPQGVGGQRGGVRLGRHAVRGLQLRDQVALLLQQPARVVAQLGGGVEVVGVVAWRVQLRAQCGQAAAQRLGLAHGQRIQRAVAGQQGAQRGIGRGGGVEQRDRMRPAVVGPTGDHRPVVGVQAPPVGPPEQPQVAEGQFGRRIGPQAGQARRQAGRHEGRHRPIEFDSLSHAAGACAPRARGRRPAGRQSIAR